MGSPSVGYSWSVTWGWCSLSVPEPEPRLSLWSLWNSGCGQSIKSSNTQAPRLSPQPLPPICTTPSPLPEVLPLCPTLQEPFPRSHTHVPPSPIFKGSGPLLLPLQRLWAGVSWQSIDRRDKIKPHVFILSPCSHLHRNSILSSFIPIP